MNVTELIAQAIAVLFVLACCTSCNSTSQKSVTPTFNNLECSYDGGWADDGVFSIKIDHTGRLLLSKNRWAPQQYYQGKLSQNDLRTLFLKVKDTQLEKLKSRYYTDEILDKPEYNIWVTTLTNHLQKVQAYGGSAPDKLESLRRSVCLIRDTVSLTSINRKILFATRTALYPRPPVTIKFALPPEEN